MAFPKGHKFAKGGKRPGAGRPTRHDAEVKRLAGEMAKKYLETKYLKAALDVFGMLATGKGPNGGKLPKGLSIDPATVREFVSKFVPPAPRQIDLGLADTMEDFASRVINGEFEEQPEEAELVRPAIEDKREDKERAGNGNKH